MSRDRASLALHIPINRCGMTLTGHKVIIEAVGATNITTVSTVHAECDRAQYRVGVMPRHDIERPRWSFMSSCLSGVTSRRSFSGNLFVRSLVLAMS